MFPQRPSTLWLAVPGLFVLAGVAGLADELIADGGEKPAWRVELEEMGLLPPTPGGRDAAESPEEAASRAVERTPSSVDAAPGPADAAPTPVERAPAPAAAAAATHRADATLLPLRAPDLDRGREAGRFVPGRAPFRVRFRDERIRYTVMGVTALPGETVEISVEGAAPGRYRLSHQAGSVPGDGATGWSWRAPEDPGVYALQVTDPETFEFVHLNVFVVHPRSRAVGGVLEGYRIGRYPSRPLRGNPAYEAPEGFIEVGAEETGILVSPHFTVEQFLCHQPGEPRFLVLRSPLLLKLEAILERLNEEGYRTPTLHVMSGFRTPHYNRNILGRRTTYSRHLYGDAADIFVDVDGDRLMDDLNGDGYSGMSDNRILAGIVDEVERAGIPGVRRGGMGLYPGVSSGPFVHVDARGERVRW